MPGGHLTHGFYTALGGQLPFGEFWVKLGLPNFALIGLSYCLVGRVLPFRWWAYSVATFVGSLAALVGARAIH